MKRAPTWLFLGSLLAASAASGLAVHSATAPPPGAAMAEAAKKLLEALPAPQRQKASFTLEDAHRVEFFFVPTPRKGLPLKEMSAPHRQLAMAFLKTGLSQPGYTRATQIIELEKVLAELEKNPVRRDHELYYVSVFGTPAAAGTWGWRFEGHHLSLNFTVVKGTMIATTPQFMGANPAEVRVDGPLKGRRTLAAEEDLGRRLVTSLNEKQRKEAIFDDDAPADILTENKSTVESLGSAGILVKALDPKQAGLVRQLIREYTGRMPAAVAEDRLARIEKAGFGEIRFAWAGGLEPGQGHYYRVQGPTFLVEYDNTQNKANHIHTTWRDFQGDFGRDLLREHYKSAHR